LWQRHRGDDLDCGEVAGDDWGEVRFLYRLVIIIK